MGAKRNIKVFKTEDIFRHCYKFHGVIPIECFLLPSKNYLVLKDKDEMEKDPSYKQPIDYIVLYNPKPKKIFVYQRSSKKDDYEENRLFGKKSIGVGGHIEADDKDFIAARERELRDEVGLTSFDYEIVQSWYINDLSDSVGKVHFGRLFLALTDKEVSLRNLENVWGRMVSLEEFEKDHFEDSENWTKLAYPTIKECIEEKFS
jgi:predicted NUDIX family phosphoesterase